MQKILPFLKWLPIVSGNSIKADLLAGITNAVVVLPQGVAFALIAGLPPVYGLYTAVVTPAIAALFGSSYHLISGPTTAISIVIYSSIFSLATPGTEAFIQYALLLTFMAGTIQFALGITRLGSLVNFVSHSVVIGFTSGAAILIAFSQLRHITGIAPEKAEYFIDVLIYNVLNIRDISIYSTLIALVTVIVAVLSPLLSKRLPHLLLGMLAGSLLSYSLGGQENGVTHIGAIPGNLPPFGIPEFKFSSIQILAPKAFAIAMLGLIEAVAIAKSIALKSGQAIDGNQEFIGQGLSNMAGSFFSCYAGSGSFSRSGINYESGAQTPMSAIFAAISLMIIVLLLAPLAAYLPMPAMGGVIFLVAYRLIDIPHIQQILRASWQETTVMIITFGSTLLFELEYAIYFGVLFSLIFYLQRTSHPRIVRVAPDPDNERRKFTNIERIKLEECPQLTVIRIDGSLFYGAVDHVLHYLNDLRDIGVKNILIIGSGINIIDVSGAQMLTAESKRWRESGGRFFLSSLRIGAREFLYKGGYAQEIGEENIFENKDKAIKGIFPQLNKEICQSCTAKVFNECQPWNTESFREMV